MENKRQDKPKGKKIVPVKPATAAKLNSGDGLRPTTSQIPTMNYKNALINNISTTNVPGNKQIPTMNFKNAVTNNISTTNVPENKQIPTMNFKNAVTNNISTTNVPENKQIPTMNFKNALTNNISTTNIPESKESPRVKEFGTGRWSISPQMPTVNLNKALSNTSTIKSPENKVSNQAMERIEPGAKAEVNSGTGRWHPNSQTQTRNIKKAHPKPNTSTSSTRPQNKQSTRGMEKFEPDAGAIPHSRTGRWDPNPKMPTRNFKKVHPKPNTNASTTKWSENKDSTQAMQQFGNGAAAFNSLTRRRNRNLKKEQPQNKPNTKISTTKCLANKETAQAMDRSGSERWRTTSQKPTNNLKKDLPNTKISNTKCSENKESTEAMEKSGTVDEFHSGTGRMPPSPQMAPDNIKKELANILTSGTKSSENKESTEAMVKTCTVDEIHSGTGRMPPSPQMAPDNIKKELANIHTPGTNSSENKESTEAMGKTGTVDEFHSGTGRMPPCPQMAPDNIKEELANIHTPGTNSSENKESTEAMDKTGTVDELHSATECMPPTQQIANDNIKNELANINIHTSGTKSFENKESTESTDKSGTVAGCLIPQSPTDIPEKALIKPITEISATKCSDNKESDQAMEMCGTGLEIPQMSIHNLEKAQSKPNTIISTTKCGENKEVARVKDLFESGVGRLPTQMPLNIKNAQIKEEYIFRTECWPTSPKISNLNLKAFNNTSITKFPEDQESYKDTDELLDDEIRSLRNIRLTLRRAKKTCGNQIVELQGQFADQCLLDEEKNRGTKSGPGTELWNKLQNKIVPFNALVQPIEPGPLFFGEDSVGKHLDLICKDEEAAKKRFIALTNYQQDESNAIHYISNHAEIVQKLHMNCMEVIDQQLDHETRQLLMEKNETIQVLRNNLAVTKLSYGNPPDGFPK